MANKSHALDFYLELSKGRIPNHTGINKFGFNADVDTGSTPETSWSAGGLITFPTTGAAISVVSDDTNDDEGSTGAEKIKVFGLDANYNLIEEDITMNGTSAVTSTTHTNWIRVYRARVTEAGSSAYNEGNITITIGGTTVGHIPAEYGQSQQAVYTVPANHTGYITNFSGAIVRSGSNRHATLGMYAKKDGVQRLIQELAVESSGSTTLNKTFTIPVKIEEKTDVYVNVIEVSSNNTNIFSNFGMVIFK